MMDHFPMPGEPVHRRAFLAWAAAVGLIARSSRAGDGPPFALIERKADPRNAETPVSALTEDLTPAARLFVRNHFAVPAVDRAAWRLKVGGLVDRPFELDLDELARMPRRETVAVLQCSGNGRALFDPVPSGVAWVRGAVGNARWGGVTLLDLLGRAGVQAEARHVRLIAADRGPVVGDADPTFFRSIPLDRALDGEPLVATTINGEALPADHGGPARLAVPGWPGNHWIKWLIGIDVAAEPAPSKDQRTDYLTGPADGPPVPITWLNVKSLIVTPDDGATIEAGRTRIEGFAWSGADPVTRVEVSIDGGPWRPAELGPSLGPRAWRRWHLQAELGPGEASITARATDASGASQPERPAYHPRGYMWNGIDRVVVKARG